MTQLLTFAGVALLALLGAAPTVPSNAPTAGTVVDGVIARDAETLRDISRTAATRLERRRAAGLRLVVTKSRFRLDLFDAGGLVKTFPVALGTEPAGAKQREGDGRTPEGKYVLLPRHASPAFGSCFYVCYPNEADLDRGLAAGLVSRPTAERNRARLARRQLPEPGTGLGGQILLHAVRDRSAPGLTDRNWTLGCIAMEGKDLEELLALYGRSDRPVLEIRP